MDNRILALCELSNDLLYHKIPREKLSYYIDASLKAGKDAASEFLHEDLAALYEKNGITVEYRESGKGAYGIVYRGQITLSKSGCSLEVFTSSIRELAEHSAGTDLLPIDYELAKKIHLAHEFFHYLEYSRDQTVSQMLNRVLIMNFLGLKRYAAINRCSEVAAHAFAMELLKLPVLPNYYDYRYLINTGKMTAAAFDGMMADYGSLL